MANWTDQGDHWLDEESGIPVPKAWAPTRPEAPTDLGQLMGVVPPAGANLPGAAQAPGAFQAPAVREQVGAQAVGLRPTAPTPGAMESSMVPTVTGPPPAKDPAPGGLLARGGTAALESSAPPKADPYAMADQSLQRQGQAEGDRAGVRAAGLDQAAKANQVKLAKVAEMQQKASAAARADMDALTAEYQEIDKDLPEEGLNTGQVIAGAIAAAFQGALKPAGPNSVVSTMGEVIDRKARARAAELQKRRAVLSDKAGLMKDKAAVAREEIAALDLIRAQEYDAALKQVDADIAAYDSPIAKEKLMQTRAELVSKRDESRARAEQQAFENHLAVAKHEEDVAARKAQIGLGYANLKLQREQMAEAKAARAEAAKTEAEKDSILRTVDNLNVDVIDPATGQKVTKPFVAKTEKDATEIAGTVAALKTLDKLLAERIRLRDKYGSETDTWLLTTDGAKEMNALDGQIKGTLKEALKLGAWDNGTQGFLEDMLGDPTGFKDTQIQTRKLREAALLKANDYLQSKGFKQFDAEGNLVPFNPAGAGVDPLTGDLTVDVGLETGTQRKLLAKGGLVEQKTRGLAGIDAANADAAQRDADVKRMNREFLARDDDPDQTLPASMRGPR